MRKLFLLFDFLIRQDYNQWQVLQQFLRWDILLLLMPVQTSGLLLDLFQQQLVILFEGLKQIEHYNLLQIYRGLSSLILQYHACAGKQYHSKSLQVPL